MSTLITARFQEQATAELAAGALKTEGFSAAQIATFYVGSPGQHDIYPLGGDEMKSPGMEDATVDGAIAAAVGGSAGLVAGLVTLPLLGPAALVAGAGVGAWMGSLYGALDGMKDEAPPPVDGATHSKPAPPTVEDSPRKSGMLVAVAIENATRQAVAVSVLRMHGGMDLGHANGTLTAGQWADFDPLAPLIPLPD